MCSLTDLLTPKLTLCLLCRQCSSSPQASKPLAARIWWRLSSGSALSNWSWLMVVTASRLRSVNTLSSSSYKVWHTYALLVA
jgi:hypothetical protein